MKSKVLVFPCGTEIGLEIHRSLKFSKDIEMFGASSCDDNGCFVYKNYIGNVPFVDDENFIPALNGIIENCGIDFIFPAHDSVVLKLARAAQNVRAKVLTSEELTCDICRHKNKTYKYFKDIIKTPPTYEYTEVKEFPVFVKPNAGQGSKGAMIIRNNNELQTAVEKNDDIVICEYLPGKEFTVDCFTNRKGELIFCGARTRSRILNGISVNSKPIDNQRFLPIAKLINSSLKFEGVWFFQVKENAENELVLLEIAPRLAGTMDLYRGKGINFALLNIYNAMGIDVEIIQNDFDIELDRSLSAKYRVCVDYKNVYVDFDDTILLENTVNTEIIKFLYQEKNKNNKIILL